MRSHEQHVGEQRHDRQHDGERVDERADHLPEQGVAVAPRDPVDAVLVPPLRHVVLVVAREAVVVLYEQGVAVLRRRLEQPPVRALCAGVGGLGVGLRGFDIRLCGFFHDGISIAGFAGLC